MLSSLPLDFISTITNTFGADGEQFIANLPALIAEASAWWGIEDNTGWKIRCSLRKPSPKLNNNSLPQRRLLLVSNIAYIPMMARMAYASASQGTNTPRNGTKAARPVHKKNNHIHQPEIVLGNEIFISYTPKMDCDRPRGRC